MRCEAVWCGELWYSAIWNVWYDISFYVMFFLYLQVVLGLTRTH